MWKLNVTREYSFTMVTLVLLSANITYQMLQVHMAKSQL